MDNISVPAKGVVSEVATEPVSTATFADANLSPVVLSALKKAGMITPTPIQAKVIPIAMTGRDLIGIAQTGTGKTLAFTLPIIEKILAEPNSNATYLIIVPTRELAIQVRQSITDVTKFLTVTSPRSVVLIGGMPIYRQIRDLKGRPQIIVATPGRLKDHMNQKTVNLNNIATLVLDEADRMLDMGFAPQIRSICDSIPKDHQTMLFSATLAGEIAKLASQYLNNPERIEVAKAGSNNIQIKQEMCYVAHDKKTKVLGELLQEHTGTILVFSRTKHGASKLSQTVQTMGHSATDIHSNKSLGQRRQALDGFRSGKYRVLIATDVASRGIDVPDIAVVINYDLPDSTEDYVHRIGRTGRANKMGIAISLATSAQRKDVKEIEKLINFNIPLSKLSDSTSNSGSSYDRGNSYDRGGSGRERSYSRERNFNSDRSFDRGPRTGSNSNFGSSPKPAGNFRTNSNYRLRPEGNNTNQNPDSQRSNPNTNTGYRGSNSNSNQGSNQNSEEKSRHSKLYWGQR